MESRCVKYTSGYKYMNEKDFWFYTAIILDDNFETRWVTHFTNGWCRIKKGFGWDGCSSLAIDDKTNMRAGLAHDGMYYLFRHGFPIKYRSRADNILKEFMVKDGASRLRAAYYRWAVRHFAKSSADPKNKRKILTAP